MEKNLAKTYNPKEFEDRIYNTWESNGCFRASVDKSRKPFSIVMPPPNITGQLHMGHALDQTLQDVLTRWKRMQGYNALWLPGTDHASIATEVKVAEKIWEEERKTKYEIGRDDFLNRAWEWKRTYGRKITEQIRKLGNSCDWERERFTMDEGCSRAVTEFFVRLYNKGLIYKGNRLVNWCPKCSTSLSDAEVEHEEKSGKYYYIKYPVADESGEYVVIATSRPETMFGDTAVAVHPEDGRYRHLIGKMVILPIAGRKIEIIADEYPDMEKGTGAVKITPAHDPNDFEVGERHNLEKIVCMNNDAEMNEMAGKYKGMDRYECRKLLVKELEEKGYLVKIEDKQINIGTCYRCDTVIEPMLSEQWFVKMQELAQPAIEAAKTKKLKHVPERYEKIYLHWLENIKDWCISRQLWWGHRIPAYYCGECNEIIVASNAPDKCPKCFSSSIVQDEDVLDTWFSSALWPFSTLGWPEQTEELEYFYPTDVLVTGYDIIFFWVVRMVFSGIEIMEDIPFRYVYVHGLVRDSEGRKMSKSLGNGVDPLEIIEKYGADALRFMLITGISPGNDMRFKTDKLEASRNFANKLWNASRFVLMNVEETVIDEKTAYDNLADEDKWILSRISSVSEEVTSNMEKFEFGIAAQKVYDFIWNEYCDWYIEMVKSRLYGSDEADKSVARFVLIKVLKDMLALLHPFMPFITEEIWSYLPQTESMLIHARWPKGNDKVIYKTEVEKIELIMDVIRSIRNIRAEADAPPSGKLKAFIMSFGKELEFIQSGERCIKNLANISEIAFIKDKSQLPEEVMSAVISNAEIFIPLDELIDYKAEFERLEKEKEKMLKELERVGGKLSNENFLQKAPKNVVEEEQNKFSKYKDMLEKIEGRIAEIKRKIG